MSMFETRTDAWHKAGLGEQLEPAEMRTAWLRLILFSVLIAAVLVAFSNRRDLFPGFLTEARIVTASLLFILGWGFASALGRSLTPTILRRMDPGTAGTASFVIKLVTIVTVGAISLHIAGVQTSTLAVGGAFTAVVLGLAAQQTLGNIFAGVVLQSTRPFRVGERVRLIGGPLAGAIEGTVSSLGLFHTSILDGNDRIMVPNNVLLNLAIVPLREPRGIDIKARFDSHVSPRHVQAMLKQAITVPTLREPSIWLDEIDRDEVVLQISATPVDPDDGATLAEQILSVTRGTFEYKLPDDADETGTDGDSSADRRRPQDPDPEVPTGHS
ncbi:MAG: mechanosensitive ion channel family protein [Solirubrobacterales bacterium]